MPKNIDKMLQQALIKENLLRAEDLKPLMAELEKSPALSLGTLVVEKGLMNEEEVLTVLSREMTIPLMNLHDILVEKTVIDKVPLKIASYYKFMPIKIDSGVLTIAVAYPLEIKTQDEIRIHLGYHIEMVLATAADIAEMLKTHYGLAAETIQKIISKAPKKTTEIKQRDEERIEDIEQLSEEESVIKLVNQIIVEAYRRRATDIHMEPYRGEVRLRYRIDGRLYNAPVPLQIVEFYSAILSRFKIMSNLDIVERRLPQDGRAVVKVQDQVLDLRISTIPTPYDESLVIRLLPTKMLFNLEKLGLNPKDQRIFENLVTKPHGIILVTGPTGSGKTTTLYTCLSRINTEDRKIITIEDPIEYELKGVTQMQVSPEVGLDFARGLRSMLRHDPDVMMLGEIRDKETADIALRLALTGHLVFSTLHTNDAAGGIIRLVDIGLEPYLIASSVEAFIAQRLVRVICPHCKVEEKNHPEGLKIEVAKDLGCAVSEVKFFRGKGCKVCTSTGFAGRTGVYEILLLDNAIKDMILKRASSTEIKRVAMRRGMHTLRQDGWRKVISGITPPGEVVNITQAEAQSEDQEVFPVSSTPIGFDTQEAIEEGKAGVSDEVRGVGRRLYARLNTKVNVTYRLVKSKEKLAKAQPNQFSTTENLGAGGILLTADSPISVSSILELKIELPDAEKPIECLGKVLRVEEIDPDKSYKLAVCFLDIPSAERTRLKKYVEEEIS